MMSNNRSELRQNFFDAWQKMQHNQELSAHEQQLAAVISDHPEYHKELRNPDKYLDKDYLVDGSEANPFMHMSLHLAIRDQTQINQPIGISAIFNQLLLQLKDRLEVEHIIMSELIDQIWKMQKNNHDFNHKAYLAHLKRLVRDC